MNKKITFEFMIETMDDEEEVIRIIRSSSYASALHRIHNEVFRPARKHGYCDQGLNKLLDDGGSLSAELVSALEQKFFDILTEEGLSLD